MAIDMETKDWISILQKERELLIKKIKWGVYIQIIVVIPILLLILDLMLSHEPIFFPCLGVLAQIIMALVLLAAIIFGPLIFIYQNYQKYKKFEGDADKILSKKIKSDTGCPKCGAELE